LVFPVIVALAADTLSPMIASSATVISLPAPATVNAPVCVVPRIEVPAFNVPVVVLPLTVADVEFNVPVVVLRSVVVPAFCTMLFANVEIPLALKAPSTIVLLEALPIVVVAVPLVLIFVAPVTFVAPLTVAPPFIVARPVKFVAPVTPRVPPTVEFPVTVELPLTVALPDVNVPVVVFNNVVEPEVCVISPWNVVAPTKRD